MKKVFLFGLMTGIKWTWKAQIIREMAMMQNRTSLKPSSLMMMKMMVILRLVK